MSDVKVGTLACCGEECLGGTISRLATRKVLEGPLFGRAVTLCLPLFIAGGEEERDFAKEHPVIAVDGCDKRCAVKATEKYSGKVASSVVLSDILGEDTALSKLVSAKDLTDEHFAMIDKVASAICSEYDKISGTGHAMEITGAPEVFERLRLDLEKSGKNAVRFVLVSVGCCGGDPLFDLRFDDQTGEDASIDACGVRFIVDERFIDGLSSMELVYDGGKPGIKKASCGC